MNIAIIILSSFAICFSVIAIILCCYLLKVTGQFKKAITGLSERYELLKGDLFTLRDYAEATNAKAKQLEHRDEQYRKKTKAITDFIELLTNHFNGLSAHVEYEVRTIGSPSLTKPVEKPTQTKRAKKKTPTVEKKKKAKAKPTRQKKSHQKGKAKS